jgi:hypothetical protein
MVAMQLPKLKIPQVRAPVVAAAAAASVAALWAVLAYWTRLYGKRAQLNALSPPTLVRETTAQVMEGAKHVSISKPAIQKLARELTQSDLDNMRASNAFDAASHFVDRTWRTAQYLLCVDALNFCFWPGAISCAHPLHTPAVVIVGHNPVPQRARIAVAHRYPLKPPRLHGTQQVASNTSISRLD